MGCFTDHPEETELHIVKRWLRIEQKKSKRLLSGIRAFTLNKKFGHFQDMLLIWCKNNILQSFQSPLYYSIKNRRTKSFFCSLLDNEYSWHPLIVVVKHPDGFLKECKKILFQQGKSSFILIKFYRMTGRASFLGSQIIPLLSL